MKKKSIQHIPSMQDSSVNLKRNAEAARYAVLRRLAPVMRHDMAGGLQPVVMLATIVEKRLLSASPDFSILIKNSNEMQTLATTATRSNLDLMGWLALDVGARVGLSQGMRDAMHFLATEFSFKGFKFVDQTMSETTEVGRDHLRGVFMAALLALTDAATSPANVVLTVARDGQDMLVTISLTDVPADLGTITPHEKFQIDLASYRKIDWDDVQAIADVDGLSVTREAGSVMLRLPLSAG